MLKLRSLSRHEEMVDLGSTGSHEYNEEVIEEELSKTEVSRSQRILLLIQTQQSQECHLVSTGCEIPQKWNSLHMGSSVH